MIYTHELVLNANHTVTKYNGLKEKHVFIVGIHVLEFS